MNLPRVLIRSLIAASAVCLACGDDDKSEETPAERAPILNLAASEIAAYGLSDTPPQEYVLARGRVEARVPPTRTAHARTVALSAGSGPAVVADEQVTAARRLAATALGAKLDPAKEVDSASAQASLDALLVEVQKITPSATSCSALPEAKASACAIAFLILEVRRSEGTSVVVDAGAGDSSAADSGSADAGSDAGSELSAPFACSAPRDIASARMLNSAITADETWAGKLLVKGRVLVSGGAKITIAAGTEIYMDVDSELQIGWNNSDASVFANGTPSAPIKFCGKTAEKGFWEKLYVGGNVTSDSYLRNVLIAEGGGTTSALELEADITVDNVQVVDSGKDGVTATDFKAGSQFLSVRGSVGAPLVLEAHGAVTRLPLGGTFTGNGTDTAILRFGTIDGDATVHSIGVPYLQELRTLQSAGTLTVEPGVEWRVKPDVTLELGWNNNATTVKFDGTSVAPVLFRCVDEAQNWGGIVIGSNVSTASKIAYTEIRQGGKARDAALQVDAAIVLDHVTLKQNVTGVSVSDVGLHKDSNTLTVSETQARPLVVENNGVFSLPSGSVLTGNTIDQILLSGGTWDRTGTVPNLGVPYYFGQDWFVRMGSLEAPTITFTAGTTFVFAADTALDLSWNGVPSTISAVGTSTAPIRFQGGQAGAGFWTGLRVGSSARTNSRFDYIEVSGAGGDDFANPASLVVDANVSITNSKFLMSSGFCLYKGTGVTADYTAGGNTFDCASGAVGPAVP